jgi:hypothetical protein
MEKILPPTCKTWLPENHRGRWQRKQQQRKYSTPILKKQWPCRLQGDP